jgi:hypothetical protein
MTCFAKRHNCDFLKFVTPHAQSMAVKLPELRCFRLSPLTAETTLAMDVLSTMFPDLGDLLAGAQATSLDARLQDLLQHPDRFVIPFGELTTVLCHYHSLETKTIACAKGRPCKSMLSLLPYPSLYDVYESIACTRVILVGDPDRLEWLHLYVVFSTLKQFGTRAGATYAKAFLDLKNAKRVYFGLMII